MEEAAGLILPGEGEAIENELAVFRFATICQGIPNRGGGGGGAGLVQKTLAFKLLQNNKCFKCCI